MEPLLRGDAERELKEGSMSVQLSLLKGGGECPSNPRLKTVNERKRISITASVAFLSPTRFSFLNTRLPTRVLLSHNLYTIGSSGRPALASSLGSQVASVRAPSDEEQPARARLPSFLPSFLPSLLLPSTEGRVSQSEFLEFSLLK